METDSREISVKEAETLGEKVDRLADRVTIARTQVIRLRNVVISQGIIGVCVVISLGWLWLVAQDARDAAGAVSASQVVNCQNANEQRAAATALWDFILDASAAAENGEPKSLKERLLAEQFKLWVHELYQVRDCTQLDKKYEIPAAPVIG